MTNKEFIQNEIDNLKNMLKNAKDLNCESIIKCSKEEIKQYNQVLKDLEALEALKPYLKKVLEINKDGTKVFFKAIRYFNGYVADVNGNWNETEQIKKNKKIKEWLDEKD